MNINDIVVICRPCLSGLGVRKIRGRVTRVLSSPANPWSSFWDLEYEILGPSNEVIGYGRWKQNTDGGYLQ